jgi:drug/metabolite transporter (DMT)-like permease
MTFRSRSLGVIALVATAALWGSNHVVARAAREIVPLPALVFWRWALAALALTVIAWPALRLAWPETRPRLAELGFGGAIGVGVFSYLLLGGAYQSLAIEVGFINATTPMWVLLIGLLTGRRKDEAVTPVMIAGLALAFAGTLLIISKGRVEAVTGLHLNLGNLWSLLAAITFAWFSIRVRDWMRIIPPLPLMVITGWSGMLLVMLPVYLVWILYGGPWLAWHDADIPFALAAVGYTALIPTMVGNLFYLFGVATNGPARAAIFLYLSPLFSAGLAIGWLGEEIAWYHLAGVVAILTGLYLVGRSAPSGVPAPPQRDRPVVR